MTGLEEARALLDGEAGANVVPVVHRFVEDCETPVSAFLKLRASELGRGPAYLLESAEQGQLGRYSFAGFMPHSLIRWSGEDGGTLRRWSEAEIGSGDPSGWAEPEVSKAADPYAAAREYVAAFRAAGLSDATDGGGAVGFFGYDLVRTVEPLGDPPPDPLGLPDMALMVCRLVLVFDHLKRELAVVGFAFVGEEGLEIAHRRARALIDDALEILDGPVPTHTPAMAASGAARREVRFESNLTREAFESNTSRIVEYVHAGDAFQVVPSQRFSAKVPVGAFSIYRGLRAVNPSPYMYFLDFGDFQLAGASPEPLIKVDGRRVETRPIAGTYPRGSSEEEDRRQAEALLADPKERAEHVMLVDLGRNDLGRVSEYGSVSVDEFMIVETYSHVLHIVSAVSGRLRDDVDAFDALRATLPAGTLSGAPKVRAMQIIDELEPVKRCSYGGAIGHVSFDGDLDTAIHIRTVVCKDGMAHVQAGGGTVADAVPEREFQESVNKAKAVFAAVELAAGQPDWE
ncbi:anthranilate synthase component I family protein [Thermoleophilia bacterium SCSIO 60948]|nr:anthranilate synthase component I family protein [Thermoleophilia bacterium SCSIO 60948]